MSITPVNERTRAVVLRLVFVATMTLFGWRSLQGEWEAVLVAARQAPLQRLVAATALVLGGLVCTGVVWQRVLMGYGWRLTPRASFSVFFLGQLGKYVPGSVWSLAAQGAMARRFGVPVRTTLATGLVFLYWNLATATLLAAVLTVRGDTYARIPSGASITAIVAATLAMAPNIVTMLANTLAGSHFPNHTRWRDITLIVPLMLLTWSAYGLAVACIAPDGGAVDPPSLDVKYAIAVFAVAYAVGVLVPLAPAGLGIRETTLTFLLAPPLGVAAAAGIAILIRLIHTAADFGVALISWFVHQLARN